MTIRHIEPEERGIVQFRPYGTALDFDAHTLASTGMSIEEQRREAQASMRVVAFGILAGLIILAVVAVWAIARSGDGPSDPATELRWVSAGECRQNVVTGSIACPVIPEKESN